MIYPIITFIKDWFDICIYIFILPLVVLLVMSFFIVEPPEYLFTMKRYD